MATWHFRRPNSLFLTNSAQWTDNNRQESKILLLKFKVFFSLCCQLQIALLDIPFRKPFWSLNWSILFSSHFGVQFYLKSHAFLTLGTIISIQSAQSESYHPFSIRWIQLIYIQFRFRMMAFETFHQKNFLSSILLELSFAVRRHSFR